MMEVREFVICAMCGTRTEAVQPTQVYCSYSCKKKALYRRQSSGIQSATASSTTTTRRGRTASAKSRG